MASDVDLFSDDVKMDPYPHYRALRDAGPAVFIERLNMWALPRYKEARSALADWENLTSVEGVGFNEQIFAATKDSMLLSDPPLHTELRRIHQSQLSARALRRSEEFIERKSIEIVDKVLADKAFDAAWIAAALPVQVVGHLVGFPESIVDRLLEWAEATFDAFGPMNEQANVAFAVLAEMLPILTTLTRDDLAPESIGRAVYDAAARGEFPDHMRATLLWTFTGPALDTTISGLGTALWQLAAHPDQWRLLTESPKELSLSATNEALRFGSPNQMFARTARADWPADDERLIPAKDKVIVLLGSANRDERHYVDPDEFNILRRSADHLAFGHGLHLCVGAPLARLEIGTLLRAMAERIRGMQLEDDPTWHLGNMVKKLTSCPVSVTGA